MSVFHTDPNVGLSTREIPLKKKLFGDNQLKQGKEISAISIFISQFKDFMILVLLVAALISAFLGEIADAIAIAAIVVLNGIMGFVQEYRTEKSLQALQQLAAPVAKVLRDGEVIAVPARDIVPGDIVLLGSGDRVPADGSLIVAENLRLDESLLTGESVPVKKTTSIDEESQSRIYKQNYVYMGTLVVNGRGKMVVEKIGMDTEMGKIAGMIEDIGGEQTPLQKRLDLLGKQLVIICLAICGAVALLGVFRGEKIYDMFLFGVSLAVAAIPEGLPAIVTIVLTLGVQRMIRKNVVIRRLPAVETLGCATVICSDKTGTLTENKMSVREIYLGGETFLVTGTGYRIEGEFLYRDGKPLKSLPKELKRLLEIGVSCNNSGINIQRSGNVFELLGGKKELVPYGDPTEIAILMAGLKGKVNKHDVDADFTRLKEIPFDSDRKRMSVLVKSRNGELFLFTKGAPDVLLPLCTKLQQRGEVRAITKTDVGNILNANEDMGRKALRVLGFAYKKLSINELEDSDLEKDLTFVGMMGLMDPPRPEAISAVQKCLTAGIRPVMITGDHKSTAWAVARELSMLTRDSRIVTGQELDNMSESELLKQIEHIAVFARVTPRHKLRIVRSLKKKGHIVAMTGDGVNDAPAVKEADIGVAMGINGTDVTKEASSMILMDDNFASIVAAVEEGRIIYDNIRKFLRYLLSCNVGEILTMIWTTIIGLPLPLLPVQILWVNLVTDGLPALALGVDPPERDVMHRKPRGKKENVFSQGLGNKIVYRGFIISLATLAAFTITNLYSKSNLEMARTAAFATLVMSQLLFVFECRTEKSGIRWQNPFGNIYLTLSVMISTSMLLAVIYVPLLQPIFHTVPLDVNVLLLVLGLAGLGALI
ncbi:MAG: cation-translocating P-type ATPase [Tepidanaerobacteraceae bacterium]